MSTGDKVTLVGAILAFLGILVSNRTQRWLAERAAAHKQSDEATAQQEEVTAEQIRAEDSKEARYSQDVRWFVDELKERLVTLETEMRDLRADLEQVRHIEREHRRKVERLTNENTALREQVERLKAENRELHARLARVEEQTHSGDAPTGPGPAGAPPAIA